MSGEFPPRHDRRSRGDGALEVAATHALVAETSAAAEATALERPESVPLTPTLRILATYTANSVDNILNADC